jgi:hypothetical protein
MQLSKPKNDNDLHYRIQCRQQIAFYFMYNAFLGLYSSGAVFLVAGSVNA